MSNELQGWIGVASVILAVGLGFGGCCFLIDYNHHVRCKCHQVEAK